MRKREADNDEVVKQILSPTLYVVCVCTLKWYEMVGLADGILLCVTQLGLENVDQLGGGWNGGGAVWFAIFGTLAMGC